MCVDQGDTQLAGGSARKSLGSCKCCGDVRTPSLSGGPLLGRLGLGVEGKSAWLVLVVDERRWDWRDMNMYDTAAVLCFASRFVCRKCLWVWGAMSTCAAREYMQWSAL